MTKQFMTFDKSAFDWFCNDAAQHYEKSAPTVETWLDQVLARLADGSLTLDELRLVGTLYENGLWLEQNGAANLAYKQMSKYGTLPNNVTLAY